MPDDTVTTSCKRLTDKVRQTSHVDALGLESDAASSCSPTHAEPAAAGCLTRRNGEATRHAATLAAWEDEGGTTAYVE
jgi:hypothetical protein